MLAFLLARAGVDVVVLEKHADFLRDFRGDTIHPSTLEIMGELGLLDTFLKLPHQELRTISAFFGQREFIFSDYTHLPTRCKFIALMPQWDFLNFISEQAKKYSSFQLHMQTEAVDLIEENGRVVGVVAETEEGALEIRADLTVGCDGRNSRTRARAALRSRNLGAPIDVLWFRLPKHPGDHRHSMGRLDAGRVLVLLDRGDYWQCAYVIGKNSIEETRRAGLGAFRQGIADLMPNFVDRLDGLTNWEQIKLLSVVVDRLESWHRPGLLCIGDAAHAMSPVAGVGVNLAVQDAVAAANILWKPLQMGNLQTDDLQRVQKRRMLPTRVTQAMQVFVQENLLARILEEREPLHVPLPFRLAARFPALRRIPARFIGIGVRPEHVVTPDSAGTFTTSLPPLS
jgi:2-polyprenyl-6-methoxyphenol hydroxylase-like FAD-dependent oxidoreductase